MTHLSSGPMVLIHYSQFVQSGFVINHIYYTAVSLALYAVDKGYIHVAKASCIQLLMIHSVRYVYVRHCQFFRYHHVAMSLYYIIQH